MMIRFADVIWYDTKWGKLGRKDFFKACSHIFCSFSFSKNANCVEFISFDHDLT